MDSINTSAPLQATGPTTHFTISAWINRQATNTSHQGIFNSFRYEAAPNRSWGLGMTSGNQVRLLTDADGAAGGERINPTSATFPTLNEWMHVMVTFDPSAAGGTTGKAYVNGVPQPVTGTNTPGAAASVFPALDSLARPLIGAQEKGGALQKFLGYIDEIQFTMGTTQAQSFRGRLPGAGLGSQRE